MSWAVTGDVGERGPAINLNVFKWLHNIQSKKFCNTVNRIGPCLGKHDPAKISNVFEKLHAIQTKSWLNAVIWTGPCLGKHDQPFIWTLLKICTTSKQKQIFDAAKRAGPWQGMLGSAAQPSTWKFLKWLHNIQTKNSFNTVEGTGPCLGEHDPAKVLNVFEKLHAIRTKSWSNTVI